jgi:hypothetical protein
MDKLMNCKTQREPECNSLCSVSHTVIISYCVNQFKFVLNHTGNLSFILNCQDLKLKCTIHIIVLKRRTSDTNIFIFISRVTNIGPPLWSSGQSSWLQRFGGPGSIPGTTIKK